MSVSPSTRLRYYRKYYCDDTIQSNVIYDAMGNDLTAGDCDILDGSIPSTPGAAEANDRGCLCMGALWGEGVSETRSTEVLTGAAKKETFICQK